MNFNANTVTYILFAALLGVILIAAFIYLQVMFQESQSGQPELSDATQTQATSSTDGDAVGELSYEEQQALLNAETEPVPEISLEEQEALLNTETEPVPELSLEEQIELLDAN